MTRYRKSYLIENTTSDNRSRARKYMRKESGMSKDESMQLDHQLQTQFKNVGKCECKFMLGLTRMYMNGELEDNSTAQAVNQALGIATEEPYASKLDYDLNGMTAQQFIDTFKDKIEAAGNEDKENLSKQDFGGNNGYDIVLIDSFEKAEEYSMYTDWCVTQSEEAFENYTNGGVFYFCLKDGFEDVPYEEGPNTPLDEYGLSMIAVSIYPDGKCNTITCRWNHDNGGDDNVMTTEGLSKVIGENFYDVFKPIKRTITLGGKEYVIGNTENGGRALYDKQGNNVLGDDVEEYKINDELTKVFGYDVLNIKYPFGRNFLKFQDGNAQYMFDEWFDNCWKNKKVSLLLGIFCFDVYQDDKQNYAIYQNGKVQYLFDEWCDIIFIEHNLSEHTGVPCFRLIIRGKDKRKTNYAIYQDGIMKYLFDEWFYWCGYDNSLSEELGELCFGIENNNNLYKCLSFKNLKIQYETKLHKCYQDAKNELKSYLNQNNEVKIQHISNIITEMVIKKLR